MTPAEEFAALIEKAKAELAWHEEFMNEFDTREVLRAAIATWEAMEMQESTKSERYSVATMCRHALRYAALSATKEPKP